MATKTLDTLKFEIGSGNVYQDLGFINPDEMLVKAGLAIKISKAIKLMNLTQSQAAELMNISQDKVSNLSRGNFSRLSEKKLLSCLIRLGYDIEINIKPASTPIGHMLLA